MIRKIFLALMLAPALLMAALGYNGNGGFVATPNTELSECTTQSTSATYVTCFNHTLPDNSGYVIDANCTGIRSDVAEWGAVEKQALISRATGSASITGSVVTHFDQTGGAGWDMSVNVDSNDVRIQVKSPSETVNWTCFIKMVKKI